MAPKNKDYKCAKRIKLSTDYNLSHIKKWQDYVSSMEIGHRKFTIADLQDFAEVLLGEEKISVNNYLSTVVNYLVEDDKIVGDPFFERKYGKIRSNVKKLVNHLDPTKADPILLDDYIQTEPEKRKTLNFCTHLGWRSVTSCKITSADIVAQSNDCIVVRCPYNGKNKNATGSMVPLCVFFHWTIIFACIVALRMI